MMCMELTTGSKLSCYIDDYGFTMGDEYTINKVDENGYHVTDDDGIDIIFETITDIRNTFMI